MVVVESPARLTGRSHKKQKDFHLTLRTLTEACDAFAAATNGCRANLYHSLKWPLYSCPATFLSS